MISHSQKLIDGINRLGINADESQIQSLEAYIHAVMEFNKTYNLVRADTEDEIAVNHVLDSLAAYSPLAQIVSRLESHTQNRPVQVADIGSGGGCPGLPLATVFPQVSFTLVERMEKRCVFLEDAVKKMGLKNVKVLCSAADAVEAESFDLEVFRAFHPFDKKIVKLLLRMLKKGGTLAAYKARSEKIAAEMQEVKMIVPEYKKIPLEVPYLEDHERNLVVIEDPRA